MSGASLGMIGSVKIVTKKCCNAGYSSAKIGRSKRATRQRDLWSKAGKGLGQLNKLYKL